MIRSHAMDAIATERKPWDVIVIGGGASGFGAAVDAASRGFRALLLEQSDFAKGTSSRSTKLIHGGVRYLKQGRLGLVKESLHERGLLLRNAPHVTDRLPFIVPTYSATETLFYATGLKMYDALSGELSLGPSEKLSAAEVKKLLPTVRTERLHGGIRYYDGQFDDARLVVTLAHTLHDLGSFAVNYMPVVQLLKSQGRVTGVVARDLEGGREYTIRCRIVINAGGAYSDAVRRMDNPTAAEILTISRGSHIVVDRSFLPADSALMIPKTSDGRVLFAIPWHSHTLLGTTDTPATEKPLDPVPSKSDLDFIIENAAQYLTQVPRAEHVLSTFSGLRPLLKARGDASTAKASREFALDVTDSGLITLCGGKWTTYRRMGEAAIYTAIATGGLEPRPSKTADLKLHGASAPAIAGHPGHWGVYGGDADDISAIENDRSLCDLLHPRLPYHKSEIVWAIRHEMARTVDDLLARRTRALFLNARAAIEAADTTAELLAKELGRDSAWQMQQVRSFTALARNYLPAP